MHTASPLTFVVAAVFVACSSASSGTPGDSADAGRSTAASGAGTYSGPSESGVATYYDANGGGNCSFDASPDDLDVAAMNAPQYDGSAVCGECISIAGPKGNVTVRVVDQCPECEKGHLDLSERAFAKIADVAAGRVPITWKVVACDVSGNLTYHYKDGTSQYWTAIQVRNSRLPIAALEIQKSSGFVKMERQDYNYFVDDGGAGAGAFKVRVTAVDGQQIIDTLPSPSSDTSTEGSAQFE